MGGIVLCFFDHTKLCHTQFQIFLLHTDIKLNIFNSCIFVHISFVSYRQYHVQDQVDITGILPYGHPHL
jgi:hypothetical protein